MTHWRISWRADPQARAFADRHYSRQTIGADQFVPPGRCLDPAKTRHKRDPGRCFRKAGFVDVGMTVGGLVALQLSYARCVFVPPQAPVGTQIALL